VRDLTVTMRDARGWDGDLYPSWHEMKEGLRQPSNGGPRWRPEFLEESALEVQK
jgi:hypothetical protein